MEKEILLFEELEMAKIEGKEETKIYGLRFTVELDKLKAQMLDTSRERQNIEDTVQESNNV